MHIHDPFNLRRSRDLDVFNILTGELEGIDFSNPNVCHGGKGGGGTNTVTNSAPPPQVMAAYQTALTAGQNAASAPLQQYNAPTIAGFTPDQNSAFGTIDQAQGMATPYYNQASTDINAGTANLWNGVQQFSPSTINSYMSPYTGQVLDAAVAQQGNTDAQQQQALKGNAVSSGAWGGDRAGVASAVLSGQQDLANNSTNANILNQGYTQGVGEFNTQQQAQLGANEANNYLYQQAGLGQANLGSTVESTALSGANAQESSGAVQQQLGQAALNVPYEQFQQQQAYPFQTAQYFANIAEGLGANAGGLGSSSTTAQGPSVGSQVAGFGLGGLGIAGAAGAFDSGSTAADTGSAVAARGGRMYAGGGVVPQRMAFGGLAARPSFGSGIRASTQIPDLSMTFVPSPTGQGTSGGGHGAGGPPGAQSSVTTGGQKPSSPTASDASTVVKAGRALHHYLAGSPADPADGGPSTLDPGSSSALDMQGEINPMDVNPGAGPGPAGFDTPSTVSEADVGVAQPTAYQPVAGGAYGGPTIQGDATGAFGTGDASGGDAAAQMLGSSSAEGTGAFDAAGSAAAADTAGAAAGDAGATAATAGITDALGAGTTLGAIDGATAAAAVDAGITDAAAGVVGESLASYAPLLLLAAKRGGRINSGMGTRKRYDDGGAVAPTMTGGQTPMQSGSPTQTPTQQVYNSSYQNMSPEQLQQILTRLPPGSQQQQSAQAVLNTKRMMPNVGQAPQGGFGSQQPAAQTFAGGGDVPDMTATPGGMFQGDGGIALDGPPPPMQSMIPAADLAAQTPMSKALANTTANAVRPAKTKMTAIPPPPSGDSAVGGFGTQQAGPDAAITVTGGDKVASNETPPNDNNDEEPNDSGAAYDPNGKAKHIEANPWLALAKAGFTAAAGQSPNALTNLGKGAEAGVGDYETQKVHADTVNEAADKLMNEAKQHKESLAITQQQADETARHNQAVEEQSNSEPIKDMFGNVTGFLDKKTNKVTPYNGAGGSGTASSGTTPSIQNIFQPPVGPDGQPLRGEAYLATVPPFIAANARSYKAGLLPPPSSFAAKDPKILAAYTAAQNMDPDTAPYLATSYATRQDFAKGPKTAATIQSQNVGMEHLGVLESSIKALNNGDIPAFNKFAQEAAQQMGSPVPTNFDLARAYVSDELNKAVLGGSGAVSDRDKIYNSLSVGSSNQQAMGALNTNKQFMAGQAYGLDQRYKNGTGEDDYRDKYMTPAAQAMYDKYYSQPLPPKEQLKVGKTYHTPQGPVVWDGQRFNARYPNGR